MARTVARQMWGFYQSKRNGYAPSRWHLTTLPCGFKVASEPEETRTVKVPAPPNEDYKLGVCARCLAFSKRQNRTSAQVKETER